MSKQDLINEIDGKKMVAAAALGIAYILGERAWVGHLATNPGSGKIIIETPQGIEQVFVINPEQLIARSQDSSAVMSDGLNTILLAFRDMIAGSFESIRDYCKETGQEQVFRQLHWFPFVRLLRNSLNHNFKFDFEYSAGKMAPDAQLQFSDKMIEFKQSMHENEVDQDSFPLIYGFELFEIMKHSVISVLV